ncbi:twin-arginine translocation signal domain-containing protein, partial [Algoriphagus aquimarinus]|uniref:twin-arginine translocation signal domain-containing protein n=1 Tax=Algoriphagus aquimarinus TaxID=237018 RepID=UPI0030DD6AB9
MKNNRREFFKKVGVGTAGLSLAAAVPFSTQAKSSSKIAPHGGQFLQIGDDIAIANTNSGKVRGYILNDIYT